MFIYSSTTPLGRILTCFIKSLLPCLVQWLQIPENQVLIYLVLETMRTILEVSINRTDEKRSVWSEQQMMALCFLHGVIQALNIDLRIGFHFICNTVLYNTLLEYAYSTVHTLLEYV